MAGSPSQPEPRGAVILGAGGHGRGVLETLRRALPGRPVLGFVDDDPALRGRNVGGFPVLGPTGWLRENRDKVRWLYLGLGEGSARRAAASDLSDLSIPSPPLLHPTAVLHGDVTIGEGSFIGAGVVIAHETRVGCRVLVNLNATVGHDVILEDHCSVGPGANLGGSVTIHEGAFVGMNATVVPGLTVGAWSRISAGSALLRPVGEGRKVLGNPARDLGPIDAP